MKHWDQLEEIATDNYGLITFDEASEFCVASVELHRWTMKGWLEKRGRGVYRLAKFPVDERTRFAEAVALCGGGYIYGEGVLAIHNLALVNPGKVEVAVERKLRRSLPKWIDPVYVKKVDGTYYYGIPSQKLADAIRSCVGAIPRDRLISAVKDAEREGILFGKELKDLKKDMMQ